MTILNLILDYWDSILVVLAACAVIGFLLYKGERSVIDKIIFWAVTELEREYGGGTGALKLSAAIELIYPKLPAVIRYVVSGETLQRWIEEGLTAAKAKWETNPALKAYIKNGSESE